MMCWSSLKWYLYREKQGHLMEPSLARELEIGKKITMCQWEWGGTQVNLGEVRPSSLQQPASLGRRERLVSKK